jgi:hypothetical protein
VGVDHGAVYVISGKDGAVLQRIGGEAIEGYNRHFGVSVAGIGDGKYVVGNNRLSARKPGVVQVMSGSSESPLFVFTETLLERNR